MAADLTGCRPEYRDEILCPMCLERIARSDIKILTKEHLLSKSLGGNAITLTCKPCNNVFGHKAQGHLAALLKTNESLRGGGEVRGRFTVFGQTVPVGVRVRPSAGLSITALGGSPNSFDAIHVGMRTEARSKWSMQIRFPYNPAKASTAIARAAYLVAFHQFGYRYILAQPVNTLRAEIVSAMDRHSERLCLLTGTTKGRPAGTGNEPESVIIPVLMETDQRFLIVMLKFRQNRNYWMFSALPYPEQSVHSMFQDLAQAVQQIGMCDISMSGDENGKITAQFVRRTAVGDAPN